MGCASDEGVAVIRVNSKLINQRRSDDKCFISRVNDDAVVDSHLTREDAATSDAEVVINDDCATSRIQCQVTSRGINLRCTRDTDLHRVSSDVGRGDCLVKGNRTVNRVSIGGLITDCIVSSE